MNILYISYDGMTDPLGQSQVIPYLEGLSALGHRFWLISCEKPAAYAQHRQLIADKLAASNIVWIPLEYHARPPVLSTVMDVRRMMQAARRCITDNNIDIVHCRSYISALVGQRMKQKLGTKFVFDMRGFWADERIEGNIWRLSNPLFATVYRFFKRKELQYFSQADYTISLTDNGKQEIQSWTSITNNPVPIQVIPCCADLAHFAPRVADEALRQELGIAPGTMVMSYLGSIGTWYLLDDMLRFFAHFQHKFPDAVFLFISGDSESEITARASHFGIHANNLRVRRASRADVPRYLSLSHVSLFFIKQSFSKKASSPTKMGEIMGMGIPIICNSGVGDVGSIMSELCPQAVISAFSEEDYDRIMNNIDQILQLDPDKIRAVAQKYYSLEEGVRRYAVVYSRLEK